MELHPEVRTQTMLDCHIFCLQVFTSICDQALGLHTFARQFDNSFPATLVDPMYSSGSHKEVQRIKGEYQHLHQAGHPRLPCLLSPLRIWILSERNNDQNHPPTLPTSHPDYQHPSESWLKNPAWISMYAIWTNGSNSNDYFGRWWCQSTPLLLLSWRDQWSTPCSWSHTKHWVWSAACSSFSNTSEKQSTSSAHTHSGQWK